MKTIYYKIVTIWCKYPFQDEIDEKYCEFYFKRKKKFIKIDLLRMETNTSIKEKEDFLKNALEIEKVKVLKLR